MTTIDAEVEQGLLNLELVTTSKRIAEPFEEAYQWLKQLGIHLDPRESVGTLAFAGKGIHKISHLTWAELTELHEAYERIGALEKHLRAREIAKHLVARVEASEPH